MIEICFNIFLPLECKPQEDKDCLLYIITLFLETSTMPETQYAIYVE